MNKEAKISITVDALGGIHLEASGNTLSQINALAYVLGRMSHHCRADGATDAELLDNATAIVARGMSECKSES